MRVRGMETGMGCKKGSFGCNTWVFFLKWMAMPGVKPRSDLMIFFLKKKKVPDCYLGNKHREQYMKQWFGFEGFTAM